MDCQLPVANRRKRAVPCHQHTPPLPSCFSVSFDPRGRPNSIASQCIWWLPLISSHPHPHPFQFTASTTYNPNSSLVDHSISTHLRTARVDPFRHPSKPSARTHASLTRLLSVQGFLTPNQPATLRFGIVHFNSPRLLRTVRACLPSGGWCTDRAALYLLYSTLLHPPHLVA